MRRCTPGSATTCTSESGGEAAFAAGRLMFTPSAERSRRIDRRMGACLRRSGVSCKRTHARFNYTVVSALRLAIVLLAAGSPATESSLPLDHVADVALPGRASRFDYQAVDRVNR